MALASQLGKIFQSDKINESLGVVGIDFGASSLKVVQLKMGQKTIALETYGELQLGPYGNKDIGEVVTLEPTRLTEALVDIIRESHVTTRNAVLAIPSTSSFMVAIDVPTLDEGQVASMIPVEARKYIPVSMNDITLDWFAIPDAEAEKKNITRALLAAVHNESFGKMRSVVQSAGLVGNGYEIEGFSAVRAAVQKSETATLVLELGAFATRIYILERGIVHDMHTVRHGATELTIAIAKTLAVPFGEAENIKRSMGLVSDNYDPRIREAIAPFVERLMSEAMRVLTRYETTRDTTIEEISLSGGGALLKGFIDYVSEVSHKKVVFADPFSKVEYPAFLESILLEAGPSFTIALGAALRGMSE